MVMAMKSILSGVFLLLLSISVPGLGSVVWRDFEYFQLYYNWTDAQHYCRSHPDYFDLAVYYSQTDVDNTHFSSYSVWVGLHVVDDEWTWTDGDRYNYRHEPYGTDNTETCARCSRFSSSWYSLYSWFFGGNCEASYFVLCLCQQCSGGSHHSDYVFISETMTWQEALEYCELHEKELAVLDTGTKRRSGMEERNFPAWIGLHRNGSLWEWSDGLSEYRFWESDQRNEDCAAFTSQRKDMITRNCSSKLPFICYRDNLVLVKENKTWEDALEHCRNMRSSDMHARYELVSVQPGDEHSFMITRIIDSDTEEVWTGLRFLEGFWWWVNRASMLYDMPACPVERERCGALSKNDTVGMKSRDCLEKKNFLCYRH